MAVELPMLLLPGMAADDRLFESQLARFPNLRVPSWIDPLPRETLRGYARRFARQVDPGVPCIIGGASFGGIVALEMVSHLRAVACVLIGSIRSPAELPWRWRVLRPLAFLGPDCLGLMAQAGAWLSPPILPRGTVRRLRRLAQPHAAFVRWATCAVMRWQHRPPSIRVFQIHGEADHTLPARHTRADVVVPGGSHALSLFNPTAVNEFLGRVLEWSRTVSSRALSAEFAHRHRESCDPHFDPRQETVE